MSSIEPTWHGDLSQRGRPLPNVNLHGCQCGLIDDDAHMCRLGRDHDGDHVCGTHSDCGRAWPDFESMEDADD